MEHITIGHAAHPFQIKHIFFLHDVGGQPFHAVSDLDSNRFGLDTSDLLEVSKLRHLLAVQPYFPAKASAAQ
ncbi:hypothetical protein D3C74_487650 [compost metagenome]